MKLYTQNIPRKIRIASRPARIKMRIISAARASPLYGNEIPESIHCIMQALQK